jgi:hypothetical protein
VEKNLYGLADFIFSRYFSSKQIIPVGISAVDLLMLKTTEAGTLSVTQRAQLRMTA